MIVVFEKKPLLAELEWLAGVAEQRTAAWALLSCVLIDATEEGVALFATDADLMARSELAAYCEAKGRMAIRLKSLLEVARAAPDAGVRIEKTPTRAKITSGEAAWTLPIENEEGFPLVEIKAEEPTLKIPGTLFASSARKVAWSTFETAFFPPAVHLCANKKAAQWSLAGVTNHTVAYVANDCWSQDASVLLTKKSLRALAGMGDEELGLMVDELGVHAKSGHRSLKARPVDQPLADYQRMIGSKPASKVEIDREALAAMIRRVALGLDSTAKKLMKMQLSNGRLILSALGDLRQANESVAVEHSGEVAIGFNPDYVLSALAEAGTERVTVETFPGGLFIKPVSGGDLAHVAVIAEMAL